MKPHYALLLVLSVSIAACNGTPDGNLNRTGVDDDEHYFALPDDPGEVIRSDDQAFYVQVVVEGLDIPWGMAFLPDGSVLITERRGTLRLVGDGQLHPEPIAGAPEVFARNQGGLLDIAIHPDYEDNGWVYMTYSAVGDGGSHTALMRARFDAEGHRLVDQEELFRGQPKTQAGHHFGSRIVFQDGYVYFATGDRGEMHAAQDLSSHNGTLLRLHDDGRVPDDNPFVDEPGALPEIFSYGHRNIQGMDIHPETGEIWTHEHGPRGGDEINIARPGLNYGWPEITHGINYDGTIITEDTARVGLESPLHHWTPSIAPCGMAFVRGDRYPGWRNDIMVGALAPMKVQRVVLDGDRVVHEEELLQGRGRIRDVVMAPDGYLYISDETNGEIIRLLPAE